MWHVCIQLLPKTVPPVRLFSENKKSPPCRLTERGAIPYNKGREYTATCGLGPNRYFVELRNRHLPGWRFHRFRLMRIVTVQPRICNVMVIGIISPPFRECSPNRPPLMFSIRLVLWTSRMTPFYHKRPSLSTTAACIWRLFLCFSEQVYQTSTNPSPESLVPQGVPGFCRFGPRHKSTKCLPREHFPPIPAHFLWISSHFPPFDMPERVVIRH